MNEIKYGLISKVDSKVLEKTIDLICEQFPDEMIINFCEIGVYGGDTAQGLYEYAESKGKHLFAIGIDNKKDNEEVRFLYNNLIIGNSTEVYHKIEDDSQDIIFVDGDHSYIGVIADYFSYKDKVKVGGYLAFHDTGKHIKKFKDFQHGDKDNWKAYISVRASLQILNLLPVKIIENGFKELYEYIDSKNPQWQLVFDEADETDPAGGICVFKKLY